MAESTPTPPPGPQRPVLFYDASCRWCRRAVGWVRARDGRRRLRRAPLGGPLFQASIGPARQATLPDSALLMQPGGTLLMRSAALLAVLAELGGGWRLLARALRLCPRRLADAAYDAVARRRTCTANACTPREVHR